MKITDLQKQWDAVTIGNRVEYREKSVNHSFRQYDGKTVTGEIVHAVKPFETISAPLLREWYPDISDDEARLYAVSGAYRLVIKTDSENEDGLPVYEILSLSPDFVEMGMQSLTVTENTPDEAFSYMDLVRQQQEDADAGYFQARNETDRRFYRNTTF